MLRSYNDGPLSRRVVESHEDRLTEIIRSDDFNVTKLPETICAKMQKDCQGVRCRVLSCAAAAISLRQGRVCGHVGLTGGGAVCRWTGRIITPANSQQRRPPPAASRRRLKVAQQLQQRRGRALAGRRRQARPSSEEGKGDSCNCRCELMATACC